MAPRGSRLSDSLPGRSGRHFSSSESGSGETQTTGHHAHRIAHWQAQSGAYHPTFSDDLSDDDSDMASITSSKLADRVPALTRGNSIASSECSVMQTEIASAFQNGCVLETDDGVLTLTSSQHETDNDLLCPFQILDCEMTFSSIRRYKLHVFSHFRGHPLPTKASCFLCDMRFEQQPEDDPALSWNNMLGHMAHEHFRRGQEFGTIRADFSLMRWMYDRKIISDHHFKRAQICPVPTMLPTAVSRRTSVASSISPTLPEAPLPPSPTTSSSVSMSSSTTTRRLSVYGNTPVVTFAGSRAERRNRDSTRPVARRQSTASPD